MDLQARLLRLLLGLLGAAVLLGGVWVKGYAVGNRHGSAKVQRDWDSADRAARKENEQIRRDGQSLAQSLQQQLAELEARNADIDAQLRDTLRAPAACKPGSRIGDIVLPAALVDSMFNRATEPGSAASGPAGRKPAR